MNHSITDLIRGVPVVGPDDSLRRAAGVVRSTDGSSVIVISQGQILGTISEKAIAVVLAQADDPETALDASVRALMDPGILYINRNVTIKDAAAIFAANDVDMLPVIDNYGNYHGVLYRADLIGYATRSLKLPPVAGMATPLGVYLTTGSVSAGAGSLGLFLTGVSLGLIVVISRALGVGALSLFGKLTGIPINIYLASPPIGTFNVMDIPFYLSMLLQFVAFGLLMRFSPLAGFHAAEHMTVHAIENGEALTPESVSRMPRVHPRCGTNLLAGASLFLMISGSFSGDVAVLAAMLVVIVGWRTVGGWMQHYITTRTPSPKQLANGVAAGQQLVDRYHKQPNLVLTGRDRIWKMGFLQTMAGAMLVMGALQLLQKFIPIPWLQF